MALPKYWHQPDYAQCPENFRDSIRRYLEYRIAPGHFMCCVLENDLAGTLSRADTEAVEVLPRLVQWIYWQLPGDCWGTKAKVNAWLSEPVCPICRETPAQHHERDGECGPAPEL